MTAERRAFLAYLSLAFVMLFWAGNAIVGRAVRGDIPPFTLAFLRWAVALIVLLPLAWRHCIRDRAALVQSWKMVFTLGILGVGCFNGFLYIGLHYTNATNALLLQAAVPAGVLLADRLLFRQLAPAWRVAGVTVSTIGVVIVIIKADISALADLRLGLGDLLVLAAVVTWSLYTSLLRLKPPVHALSLLSATFLIGALCMAPLAAVEWAAGDRPNPEPAVVAAVLYVATFPSVLSYLLFNGAVEQIGGGKAGQTTSLMPLFGALIAALVLGEPLHGYHYAGMALIFGGIAMSVAMDRKPASSAIGAAKRVE
ncbi:DMT family transporter [Sphingomonas sp. SRS2]|uniref:DMT family transporter n=1 Tax=Sphingomonas sp. SRS2 TaxID=133190 RepID=UPI0006184402|nr:DMT family transporter [Sphingomonas sp. SRS2]KKC23814.1 permease [Sphingomonas sp. SRS2]